MIGAQPEPRKETDREKAIFSIRFEKGTLLNDIIIYSSLNINSK